MLNSLYGIGITFAFLVAPSPPGPSNAQRVAEVLQRYERAMCPVKSIEFDFTRDSYDAVFSLERHWKGRVYFEASGCTRFEINPVPAAPDVKGRRYKIARSTFQKWIWKEGLIFVYSAPDEVQKVRAPAESYESYMSAQNSGSRKLIGWFWFDAIYPQTFLPPVVTGASADDLKQRFRVEFGRQLPSSSILTFFPLHKADLANFGRMDVLFDDLSGLPLAIRRFDPTGNTEEVIVFDVKSLKVNQPLTAGDDPLEMQPNEFERLLREPIADSR